MCFKDQQTVSENKLNIKWWCGQVTKSVQTQMGNDSTSNTWKDILKKYATHTAQVLVILPITVTQHPTLTT